MSLPLDKIVCGDNCDVLGTFPRECIDLVVTSPPYDDLRTYGGHSWDFYGVAWQLARVLKPGGVIVWVVADQTKDGSESGNSAEQAKHYRRLGLRQHDTMIYRKEGTPPLNHERYEQEWEYCFVLTKGKPKTWNPITVQSIHAGQIDSGTRRNEGKDDLSRTHGSGRCVLEEKTIGNVWSYGVGWNKTSKDKVAFSHPAVFPENLAADHIASWSNQDDIVLDPFNGSGTTTKMARELGRRYIGIEVNQEYCDIAEQRISQQLLPLEEATA